MGCGCWMYHIYLIWYIYCNFITRRVERLTSVVKLTILDTNPVSFSLNNFHIFHNLEPVHVVYLQIVSTSLIFWFNWFYLGSERLFSYRNFLFQISYILLKAFFYLYHWYYNCGHNILLEAFFFILIIDTTIVVIIFCWKLSFLSLSSILQSWS